MEVNPLLVPRRPPSLRSLGRRVRIPQRSGRGVVPRVVTRTTPRTPRILQRPAIRRRLGASTRTLRTPLRVLPRERKLIRRPRSTRRYGRRLPRKRKVLRRVTAMRRRHRIHRRRSSPRSRSSSRRRSRSRPRCRRRSRARRRRRNPICRITLPRIRRLAIRPEHRLPRLLIGKRTATLRPRHRRREHQPQPGTHQTQSSQHPHQPHTPIRRHTAPPR
jgi:hypothetical protein